MTEEIAGILSGEEDMKVTSSGSPPLVSMHSLALAPSVGKIFPVGAGPGHPSLLTNGRAGEEVFTWLQTPHRPRC